MVQKSTLFFAYFEVSNISNGQIYSYFNVVVD